MIRKTQVCCVQTRRKSKGERRCMKAKLLSAMVPLAVVLPSSSFLADAGKAPSLYADKMITTDKEARV